MEEKSLIEIYSEYHPDFPESLNVFSESTRKQIIKKLKCEKSKVNFRSTLAEIQFGELFNNLGFEIDYDYKFGNGQTPDWKISKGNSTAICDVYRLGKTNDDQLRSDFENQILERLEKLPFEYYLQIYFIDEYFDLSLYDINFIIYEVENWIGATSKNVGDKLMVYDNFEFEIKKINTKKNHVCCMGNANSIQIKTEKIKQHENLRPNEITKKLTKYSSIISNNELPYFIAVSIDFVSGFNHDDFIEYFLGRGVEFIDYEKKLAPDVFNHLGKNWTELGEFYNNLQLSGIITHYGGTFRLLLNPCKLQRIHNDKNILIKEKLLGI